MKYLKLKIIGLFSLGACYIFSCSEPGKKADNIVAAASLQNLSSVVTELPIAPGFKSFQNNCLTCHSARYIQMQPDLSAKTWLALVTKMQKSFEAPVPDSSVNEIVQYLVAIKGKS